MDPGRALDALEPFGVPRDLARFHSAERTARLHLTGRLADPTPPPEMDAWRGYFSTLLHGLGIPEERRRDAGRHLWSAHLRDHMWTRTDPATPRALSRLRERGYRLGVVSNADGRMASALETAGLADFFEFVVDSHAVGVEKPDARIFEMAVERMALDPGECLYVGDLYAVDVVGSRSAGLRPVLVDPFGGHEGLGLPVDRIGGVPELPSWMEGPDRSAGAEP